jgi:hypothetical protein
MEFEIGQEVYVPNPEGNGRVRATVVDFGGQSEGIEVPVPAAGASTTFDVVIVCYDEGERQGFHDRVPRHLLIST